MDNLGSPDLVCSVTRGTITKGSLLKLYSMTFQYLCTFDLGSRIFQQLFALEFCRCDNCAHTKEGTGTQGEIYSIIGIAEEQIYLRRKRLMSRRHVLRNFLVPFKDRVCTLDFMCFSYHIGVPAVDSDVKSVGHDPRPPTVPAKAIRSMY